MTKAAESKPKLVPRNFTHWAAVGFGSGLAPKAPGTFGSLAAIPLIMIMAQLPLWGYLVVTVLACLVGNYLCGRTADDFGSHDHPAIVWDEFAGMMITFIAVPLSWQTIIAGFVLFRIFDILKPWPIRWLDQHVHGGFGIMVDDLLAGAMAWLVLVFVLPALGLGLL
ncbi:phosphatidylglycerophosphatase A [Neiella marina]|uniref:Phosphatidylglycerophosphatase A n=1 Tax=Neiella holothuriorum TaxID=2870530 RepID=A0ABS7EHI8_9GAMM|nr:phosphatidylglycerophosphatase A [Neiella holothuriorum]MBW8191807.1 phosphatidylglycerophosphatase A [Neiella holothuriorum]